MDDKQQASFSQNQPQQSLPSVVATGVQVAQDSLQDAVSQQQPIPDEQASFLVQQVPVVPSGQKEVGPVTYPGAESLPQPEVIEDVHSGESNQQEALVQVSEQEPHLAPEVAEAGVEVQQTHPQLTEVEQQVGVTYAAEATPVPTQPSGMVQLPMTQQEAEAVLKTKKSVRDSIRWLAALIIKQLKVSENKPI